MCHRCGCFSKSDDKPSWLGWDWSFGTSLLLADSGETGGHKTKHREIRGKPCTSLMVKTLVRGSRDGKGDSWKNEDRCGRRNGRLMGQERSKSEKSGGLHHVLSVRLWVYRVRAHSAGLGSGQGQACSEHRLSRHHHHPRHLQPVCSSPHGWQECQGRRSERPQQSTRRAC